MKVGASAELSPKLKFGFKLQHCLLLSQLLSSPSLHARDAADFASEEMVEKEAMHSLFVANLFLDSRLCWSKEPLTTSPRNLNAASSCFDP